MQSIPTGITPQGNTDDALLKDEIIRLYENEPDLLRLPAVVFDSVARLIDADVVAYAEIHHRSGDFRALVSVEDDPVRRGQGMQAYARHMHSHPFWQYDPKFFGAKALRESDFFSDAGYFELPIAKEALLPSGSHRLMAIVIEHEGYVVTIAGHRVVGRAPYSDAERDRLEAYRPHLLRCYRQAQQRTLARLSPTDRLRMAFPTLTPRQLEVASWIAQGKSNDDISTILDVGIDTVKAHVKATYDKLGAEGRHTAAVIAHTIEPFAFMPPLWKLEAGAWAGLPPVKA
jgi:DNA-binding CsgD family transcriptional regulator